MTDFEKVYYELLERKPHLPVKEVYELARFVLLDGDPMCGWDWHGCVLGTKDKCTDFRRTTHKGWHQQVWLFDDGWWVYHVHDNVDEELERGPFKSLHEARRCADWLVGQ